MQSVDLKSMNMEELSSYMSALGQPRYRAAQLFGWIHEKRVGSFGDMTNFPKALRSRLEEECTLTTLGIVNVQESKIDGTRKYLFELSDGNLIESVLMRYHHGNSVCISSQAGCRMGCTFCASGIDGLARNLSAAEMLEQVYQIARHTGERVSNVVVMGTGEPLDNYDNLIRFIRLISDEKGMNISQRNITVSTCGLVPQMRRLADEGLTITLAISLHAPNQEKRLKLMPIAQAYDINEVMDACRYYFERTKRRVTIEYSLISGVNDSEEDADELCNLLKGMGVHVNLIPINPVKERSFYQYDAKNAITFQNFVARKKINATIRREMGRDIDGACGQLRKRYMDIKQE